MQLSLISLALTRIYGGSAGFSPLSLFASGEQGAWYDPSDLSTMFQDSAGTTPVTADGQPVGLILDKSQGLALGAEQITNAADRDFSSDTGFWAKEGTTTISGGVVNVNTATDIYPIYRFNFPLNAGYYEFTYTLTVVAGSIYCQIASGAAGFGVRRTASGTYTDRIYVPTNTGTTGFRTEGSFVGTIDNVSIKPILGNHASQATAAKRPIYKERINLVSYSENITAHFDVLEHVTITPNAVTAPDGTATADLMTEGTNLNTYFGVTRKTIVPTGEGLHTVSAWVKPNGRNYFILYAYGDYSSYFGKYFELIGSGAVLGDYYTAPTNATITAYPNGWYLCTMTVPISLADNGVWFDVYLSPDGLTDTYNGDGASGAYVWGIQIAKGAEFGPYQRVENDVYNTVGLPKWLQFDGVDDELRTAAIDFTATDKTTVWLGAAGLSATSMIFTTGDNPLNTPGAFGAYAGLGTTGDIGVVMRGSSGTQVGGYTPPVTGNIVATLQYDLAGVTLAQKLKVSVDTVPQTVTHYSGDTTEGVFGNLPLTVGIRPEGESFPFNGKIYPLIILGRQATPQEITDTEQWVAEKTGVTLP